MATAAFDPATRWAAGQGFSRVWQSLRLRTSPDERDLGLLNQFYSTLAATHQQIKSSGADLTRFAEITAEIDELLAGERSWRNAYHVEQLMVPLYSGDKLDIELRRRLLEAEKIQPPISGYYSGFEVKESTEERKRALLERLVNDLQWRYETRQVEAHYRRIVAKRTSYAFVLATLLFLAPILMVFWKLTGVSSQPNGAAVPAGTLGPVVEWHGIVAAMASGLMGAAFSMLLSVSARAREGDIEDLKTSRRWTFILSRAFVGIGASLILYYLIAAKVVGGAVFPEVDGLFTAQVVDAGFRKQFALLIVACFLAGFSERLVPNLLSRSERELEVRQAPPPRPTTTG